MKSAVLVGVNRYPLLQNCDLRGCLNDVDDLSELLLNDYGFHRVVTIVNESAYKCNIIDALNDMISLSHADDELMFAFSGHGTQIYDVSSDESDGYDECICPADTSMDDDATLISDDELYAIFSKSPIGANLTIIMDCCHSGTNTRDISMGASGKFLDRGFPKRDTKKEKSSDCRWLTLSGCKDNETSADATFDDRPNGALTYSLVRELQDGSVISATNIHKHILAFMDKNGYDQHPVLSGSTQMRNRPFFGGAK